MYKAKYSNDIQEIPYEEYRPNINEKQWVMPSTNEWIRKHLYERGYILLVDGVLAIPVQEPSGSNAGLVKVHQVHHCKFESVEHFFHDMLLREQNYIIFVSYVRHTQTYLECGIILVEPEQCEHLRRHDRKRKIRNVCQQHDTPSSLFTV